MWRLPYLLILAYRRLVSPWLPSVCRFHPSCSAYGAEAFRTHGFGRGAWLTLRRLARCHPWHPGGVDPVPPRHDGRPAGHRGTHACCSFTHGDIAHG
jgi:putative membrane protein insertion efficiency factor